MEIQLQKQINELYKKAETHPLQANYPQNSCRQIPPKKHNAV